MLRTGFRTCLRLATQGLNLELSLRVMTPLSKSLPTILAALTVIASAGCGPAAAPAAKTAPPAKVANVAKEDQLNTIQLTPEAETRLGLTLSPVESRQVER